MMSRARNYLKRYAFPVLREVAHFARFSAARMHARRLHDVRFIGITGSAGKTTTKDLATAILSSQGPCHSSPMSKNYPDGIAQIILNVRPSHKCCVMEVSGGNPGEMDRPLKMFTPEIAVLTLVQKDHFKAFNSVDEIAAEKSKLISALPANGTAVLNIDDPRVRAIGEACKSKVVWIGEAEGATLRLVEATSSWPDPLSLKVEYNNEIYQVRTRLYGEHLSLSVLAALAVGVAAGIALPDAIESLSQVEPTEGRMQIVDGGDGVTFVRDDWKAPHWSLGPPLKFMGDARARRKVIIIGTLSDYSLSASKLYPKVARQALSIGDLVIFAGPHALRALKAQKQPEDARLKAFTELESVSAFLAEELRPGDLVLLKGSNKADHLVRLYYDRQKPVQCWVSQCGIQDFCGACSRLYRRTGRSENSHRKAVKPLEKSTSSPQPLVVIGLGNPGKEFTNTPHNLGYQVVDTLAQQSGGRWAPTGSEAMMCEISLLGTPVTLFKPEVPINRSGPVIRHFLEASGNNHGGCVLVHDDADLILGETRTKRNGSAGGHKGVASVIAALGTPEIVRIRVGASRAGNERINKTSVLEPYTHSDQARVQRGVETVVDAIRTEINRMTSDSVETVSGTAT